jgi:hypothetical protein
MFSVIRITANRNVKTTLRKQSLGWFDYWVIASTGLFVLSSVAAPAIVGLVAK